MELLKLCPGLTSHSSSSKETNLLMWLPIYVTVGIFAAEIKLIGIPVASVIWVYMAL